MWPVFPAGPALVPLVHVPIVGHAVTVGRVVHPESSLGMQRRGGRRGRSWPGSRKTTMPGGPWEETPVPLVPASASDYVALAVVQQEAGVNLSFLHWNGALELDSHQLQVPWHSPDVRQSPLRYFPGSRVGSEVICLPPLEVMAATQQPTLCLEVALLKEQDHVEEGN